MTGKKALYMIRSKIWIEDDTGCVLFGLGRLKILEAIEHHGSINAAAKELKMSYRAVWARVKATEERLGKPLLVRTTGGASGGGSLLTPFARELIIQFRALHKRFLAQSDQMSQRFCSFLSQK